MLRVKGGSEVNLQDRRQDMRLESLRKKTGGGSGRSHCDSTLERMSLTGSRLEELSE